MEALVYINWCLSRAFLLVAMKLATSTNSNDRLQMACKKCVLVPGSKILRILLKMCLNSWYMPQCFHPRLFSSPLGPYLQRNQRLPNLQHDVAGSSVGCNSIAFDLKNVSMCQLHLWKSKYFHFLGDVQKVAGWVRCACSPKWGKCACTVCCLHKLGLFKPGGLPRCKNMEHEGSQDICRGWQIT